MIKQKELINIFWFRRDLRIEDNTGLFYALSDSCPVLPIFIFDKEIIDELNDKTDPRIEFIHANLQQIAKKFHETGSFLLVRSGYPLTVFKGILEDYQVKAIYSNRDYEPYAIKRDGEIEKFVNSRGVLFHSYKDQVMLEKNDLLNNQNEPYKVFTPYKNQWLNKISKIPIKTFTSEKLLHKSLKLTFSPVPSLKDIGFNQSTVKIPKLNIDINLIKEYHLTRDYPAINGTTRIGIYLRHGIVSIRKLVNIALQNNETWLNELIWREFYMMILAHFPSVINHSFKPLYDKIEWINNRDSFDKWCNGQTGYPLVDAGMRQLNVSGYMHNRIRMVTASFLTRHLLIDWRWGEAYFAQKLLDYELSSNNGGWQWAAGTGTDAQPYFRIFNPEKQASKFDPDLVYIHTWVTDLNHNSYPNPIIEHTFARNRAIETYKKAIIK